MHNDIQKQALSEEFKANLLSGDAEMRKTASLAGTEYFRTEIRENAVYRQVVPPTPVTKENFDPNETSDLPSMIVEIANESAGAQQVPFEVGPQGAKFFGRKARASFCRAMTPKYEIDKIRLEGYKMPILDVLYDLMLKDIMDVEDAGWTAANVGIVGEYGAQTAQWAEFGARRCIRQMFDRDGVSEIKKGIMHTAGKLKPAKQLMNALLYADFMKLDRSEIGGDMAQEMFVNGMQMEKVNGVDTLITNKDAVCAATDVWTFADPKYYGGFYTYNDVSMVIDEKDDIFMTFFAHEVFSGLIVNRAAVTRTVFSAASTGEETAWTTSAT